MNVHVSQPFIYFIITVTAQKHAEVHQLTSDFGKARHIRCTRFSTVRGIHLDHTTLQRSTNIPSALSKSVINADNINAIYIKQSTSMQTHQQCKHIAASSPTSTPLSEHRQHMPIHCEIVVKHREQTSYNHSTAYKSSSLYSHQ